jgi:hypothetical protein
MTINKHVMPLRPLSIFVGLYFGLKEVSLDFPNKDKNWCHWIGGI